MIDATMAREFLAAGLIAVIGASDNPKNFGRTVYVAMREHSIDVVAVNPRSDTVAGDPCYRSVADVPGSIDGALLVVPADRAAAVVEECLDLGIPRIWLFRGIGSRGSSSDQAVRLSRDHGVPVVAGACPLMFLAPVGGFHRLHRAARHFNRSLTRTTH